MTMQVYKIKRFSKWARSEKIADKALNDIAKEIEQGLVDADLGGYVFKKRIPLPGSGKRSGARILLAYKAYERLFFMYGFAKNDKANISKTEKRALQEFSAELINCNKAKINELLKSKIIEEITNE